MRLYLSESTKIDQFFLIY